MNKNKNKQADSVTSEHTAKNPLLTINQRQVDELALKLMKEAEVKEATQKGMELWKKLPEWELKEGKETLMGAAEEATFLSVRSVAANDPAYPKIIWTSAPAYSYADLKVPRSCGASDNPDRVYRAVAVSPMYSYVIKGKRNVRPTNKDFSFEAIPFITLGDKALAKLNYKDVDVASDGSFTIIMDSTLTNDRKNHLYLPPGTKTVLFRETIADWSNQVANRLTIERTDNIKATPRTYEELKVEAAKEVYREMEAMTRFIGYTRLSPVNTVLSQIRKPEDGLPGTAGAFFRFGLKQDQALVLTIYPNSADYVNVQLTDPWTRSIPFRDYTSGLSDKQARHNPDGSITFIISSKDPGYYNWLNTGGLLNGIVQVRVEDFQRVPNDSKQVISDAVLINISDLVSVLPKEIKPITGSERSQQLTERQKGYDERVTEQ